MTVFTARIDPRPVRPARTCSLLDSAIIRADGGAQGPDSEQGPAADPLGPPNNAGGVSPIQRDVGTDLSTSADYITNNDGTRTRWTAGFAYRPEACNDGGLIDPQGTTAGTEPSLETEIDVVPFLIEGMDKISTFGAIREDLRQERRDYAYRQLVACRSKLIEAELFSGAQSVASGWGNRFLADNTVVLPEGDRLTGYVTSLAILEQQINDGTCSQQGMIHCRADTATMWVSEHLCHAFGKLLVTELGTIIVPGSGYNGQAPAAGDPHLDPAHAGKVPSTDSAWAYATTIPEIFLSDLLPDQHLVERVATGANDLATRVRQFAAVTWGCLHVGVHVDHDNRTSVTGS